MRLLHSIVYDMKFQFRHGFYYAYFFITVIYVLVLFAIPANYTSMVALLILFSDITMIGFFFIGAILLFEKGQNILESLFVTPLTIREYFISKNISLGILSILSASAILLITQVSDKSFIVLVPGLILSIIFFTNFGIIIGSRAKHVNDYFVKALLISIVFLIPVFDFFHLYSLPVLRLFPSYAVLILFDVYFREYSSISVGLSLINLLIWNVIISIIAYKQFKKYIIYKVK